MLHTCTYSDMMISYTQNVFSHNMLHTMLTLFLNNGAHNTHSYIKCTTITLSDIKCYKQYF